MRSVLTLAMLGGLAACGSGSQAPAPAASPSSAAVTATATAAPTAVATATPPPTPTSAVAAPATHDLAVLDSKDCRAVAKAYFDALAQDDLAFAARVWNDPAVDQARLKTVFGAYDVPHFEIAKVSEEGAAGSSYCTVTGSLTDVADPNKPGSKGEIVLRRVNDVPGATKDQLRWTIQSSTFVEKMGQ